MKKPYLLRLFLLLFGSALLSLNNVNAKQNDPFKMHSNDSIATIPINYTFEKDTTIVIPDSFNTIYGLSVSAEIIKHKQDFLVRMVLEDADGRKYLVAEKYKEVAEYENIFLLTDYCEETALLSGIVPKVLHIYISNASVKMLSIKMGTKQSRGLSDVEDYDRVVRINRYLQAEEKARLLNTYNSNNCGLWLAGVTSLSLEDYNTRYRILGISDSESSGGIEYYKDGIFVMTKSNPNEKTYDSSIKTIKSTTSSVVSSFSWRNRHGKNWLTPVKDQGSSGYCCAFAAVSCTEALVNLYFNKKVDLDLSEQQAACCNGTTNPWSGMTLFSPLNYIMNHGVYDENAYPFVNDSVSGLQCHDASSTPNEIVKIASIASVSINHEDSIKKALIKYGPLSSLYKRSTIDSVMPGHAMSIVGYFDVHVGDTLRALRHYTGCDYCWGLDTAIIVEDKEYKQIGNIIGKTCWVFKNSSSDVPFMNILFQDLGGMYCPYRLGTPITWTSKSITLNGTDSIHTDIVCEDADGDGYYFWGIGNRPAACPSWIPSTADGDDSDFTKGKMLETPVFGELESLNPDDSPSLVISSNTTYTARQVLYSHIRITGNATLTIKDILNLLGRTTIIIDPGAQLKVDGGTVSNVNLSIASGGKVTLTNGGKLILRTNTDLEIPAGAIMDISDGEIIRSSDF